MRHSPTHGRRLTAGALLLCAAAAGCGARERPGTPPRHVLLISASSLRADHLSCYAYPRPTCDWPSEEEDREAGRALALDDLAAQGVLFHSAFSPANRTAPALAALFRGRAEPVEGEGSVLPEDAATLAEAFRDAGFETAAFLSGLPLRTARGFDQGFESVTYRFGDTPILSLAKEWLATRERRGERRLFLWIHLSGADPPHDPRAVPPRPDGALGAFDFGRLFVDPDYAGPADGSFAFLGRVEAGAAPLSPADRRRIVDLYDGEVARLASEVRGLMLFLRNQGGERDLLNDTVVVFCGLHGIELGEHGSSMGSADSLHACVSRVPLFIRHPNSLTGARVLEEPVGVEDVAPTLYDWFGLEPQAGGGPKPAGARSGRSLLPLVDSFVRRPFDSRPALALCTAPGRAAALRTRDWSLLWSAGENGSASFRLFDRVRDPGELFDVSLAHPEVALELSRELANALAEAGWGPP